MCIRDRNNICGKPHYNVLYYKIRDIAHRKAYKLWKRRLFTEGKAAVKIKRNQQGQNIAGDKGQPKLCDKFAGSKRGNIAGNIIKQRRNYRCTESVDYSYYKKGYKFYRKKTAQRLCGFLRKNMANNTCLLYTSLRRWKRLKSKRKRTRRRCNRKSTAHLRRQARRARQARLHIRVTVNSSGRRQRCV